ncbi:MAG: flagellar hook capping FlgD N-terminal domain-containing protein [Thermoguttaceae bacterium]
MSTSSIASAAASSASDSAGANGLTSLSPQDFLQMLITELQDQDPTQPVSNTEILQEVSQIDNIETNQNLSSTLTAVALEQSMSTASNLLNMNVTAEDSSGNTVSGPVSSISIANGMATLNINGTSVPFSNVTSISPAGSTASATSQTN